MSQGEQADMADLSSSRTNNIGESGIVSVPFDGIQIRGGLFVGGATKNKFAEDFQKCLRTAISGILSMDLGNVQFTSIKEVKSAAYSNGRRLLQKAITEDEGLNVNFVVKDLTS